MTVGIRVLAMVLLGVTAMMLAALSIANYLREDEGNAYMRTNAARYRAAGAFVMKFHAIHKDFPAEAVIRGWAARQHYGEWAKEIGGDRVGGNSAACHLEDDFSIPPTDVYVLYRWRGEWFDCYSLPSGTNNVVHPLGSASPRLHATLWGMAFGSLIAAFLIRPKRRKGPSVGAITVTPVDG